MRSLEGQVAIVTGGNRGIGKAIAKGFAAEGASLVLTARDMDALTQTANEVRDIGASVMVVSADLAEESEIVSLFGQVPRVDILVNNAGAIDGGALDSLTAETWDKVLNINLRAPFLCTREAMRRMKEQSTGGRIINIGSTSSHVPRPNTAPYCVSKFAIRGLTQMTALEGRTHGITASCLCPGNTYVERVRDAVDAPIEPMMDVESVVRTAVLMATLPKGVNMLEATVLPVPQLFIGRG